MSNFLKHKVKMVLGASWLILVATPAFAYIGPGAGLGAIGAFFAAIGTVLLLIVGFLWYPIKRLLKRRKTPEAKLDADADADADAEADAEVDVESDDPPNNP